MRRDLSYVPNYELLFGHDLPRLILRIALRIHQQNSALCGIRYLPVLRVGVASSAAYLRLGSSVNRDFINWP